MIRPPTPAEAESRRLVDQVRFLAEIDRKIARGREVPREVCCCGYAHGAESMTWRGQHEPVHGTLSEFRDHYARMLCVLWELDCRERKVPTGLEHEGVGAPMDHSSQA